MHYPLLRADYKVTICPKAAIADTSAGARRNGAPEKNHDRSSSILKNEKSHFLLTNDYHVQWKSANLEDIFPVIIVGNCNLGRLSVGISQHQQDIKEHWKPTLDTCIKKSQCHHPKVRAQFHHVRRHPAKM